MSCRNDISACLEWLFAAGKQPSDVILYGQSVGSGPSVYLAAVTQDIAGVVLHSALASGSMAATLQTQLCTSRGYLHSFLSKPFTLADVDRKNASY